MDQVEIKVIELKLIERLLKCLRDLFPLMAVAPEFTGDEEILSLHHARNDLLERCTDFRVITVNAGEIQMTVTDVHGLL